MFPQNSIYTADDILFQPGHYLAPANAATFYNHPDVPTNGDPNSGLPPKSSKKDRHSKIHTSQGPRDRRVRLSIGVARRFFDLQETLGFDKPSKTLDWLLTNSKTAIKDLMLTKETPISFDSKTNRTMPDLAKESRAKARARARERTRDKMCIKELNHDFNSTLHPYHYEQDQSISIKTKVKNVISPSNYTPLPSPNYTNPIESWDICAILDHHKFNNSTSDN